MEEDNHWTASCHVAKFRDSRRTGKLGIKRESEVRNGKFASMAHESAGKTDNCSTKKLEGTTAAKAAHWSAGLIYCVVFRQNKEMSKRFWKLVSYCPFGHLSANLSTCLQLTWSLGDEDEEVEGVMQLFQPSADVHQCWTELKFQRQGRLWNISTTELLLWLCSGSKRSPKEVATSLSAVNSCHQRVAPKKSSIP